MSCCLSAMRWWCKKRRGEWAAVEVRGELGDHPQGAKCVRLLLATLANVAMRRLPVDGQFLGPVEVSYSDPYGRQLCSVFCGGRQMMGRRIAALVSTLPLLALVSSASPLASDRACLQLLAEIRMLEQQLQKVQTGLVRLSDGQASVGATSRQQLEVSRKSFADQGLLVSAIATDVRVLREKVDETNTRLAALSRDVDAIRVGQTELTARVTAPSKPPDAPSSGDGSGPLAQSQPSARRSFMGVGTSPELLFEASRSDYYRGDWALAIDGFGSYIRMFPHSDLADDAQFYVGEANFGAGRLREAVGAYELLIENYPSSNMLPVARTNEDWP